MCSWNLLFSNIWLVLYMNHPNLRSAITLLSAYYFLNFELRLIIILLSFLYFFFISSSVPFEYLFLSFSLSLTLSLYFCLFLPFLRVFCSYPNRLSLEMQGEIHIVTILNCTLVSQMKREKSWQEGADRRSCVELLRWSCFKGFSSSRSFIFLLIRPWGLLMPLFLHLPHPPSPVCSSRVPKRIFWFLQAKFIITNGIVEAKQRTIVGENNEPFVCETLH